MVASFAFLIMKGVNDMKLLTRLRSKLVVRLLEKYYVNQRVFLNSIGRKDYDVDFLIGLKINEAIHYHPELDCILPKMIDTWYEQRENPNAALWTEQDENEWRQIMKS